MVKENFALKLNKTLFLAVKKDIVIKDGSVFIEYEILSLGCKSITTKVIDSKGKARVQKMRFFQPINLNRLGRNCHYQECDMRFLIPKNISLLNKKVAIKARINLLYL